jgi:hypothetical protein
VIDVYARISYAVTGETVKTDDQVEMGEEALERRGAVLRRVFRDESMKGARPGLRFRMSHSRGEWTKCSTAVDYSVFQAGSYKWPLLWLYLDGCRPLTRRQPICIRSPLIRALAPITRARA